VIGSYVLAEGSRTQVYVSLMEANFESVCTNVGGPGGEGKGKVNSASRAKTVEAVLDFAEASQRFQSRAP
jgi:hypothetical protein